MRSKQEYREEILKLVREAGPDGVASVDVTVTLVRANFPDTANIRPALLDLMLSYEVLRSPVGILTINTTKEDND